MRRYCSAILKLALLSALIGTRCTGLLDPGETVPSIHFTASGGIAEKLLTDISIDSEGLVIYHNFVPILDLQLTEEEHEAILNLFNGFEKLDSTYYSESICPDDVYYAIEYATTFKSKTVKTSGCGLLHAADEETNLAEVIGAMYTLADTIYHRQAPWVGLTLTTSLNSDTYGIKDTVTLTYTISNPTKKNRKLYFKDQNKFFFRVQ